MHVIVYSTPTCPFCKQVKAFLSDNSIVFEDIDVAVDTDRAQEMIQKSEQMGVPVIDIEGEIVIGFDEPRLRAILEL